MRKIIQTKNLIIILIIMSVLMSVLSACSKKDKSRDVSSDSENIVKKSEMSTTPAAKKASPSPAAITPTVSPKALTISSAPKPDTISIKYIGNSCFYITFQDGTKLVTDPYGYSYERFFGKIPAMEADVMCITHNHDDHISGIKLVKGNPQIIQEFEKGKTITVGKVKITQYGSDHVANMGSNIIYVFQSGDLKIVDMGETDKIASKEAINAVKGADVILAYAGEYGDIKNKDSFKTLSDLDIKAIIPQHYSNNPKQIFYGQPTIDKILTEIPAGMTVTETNEFIVSKDLKQQFINLKPWESVTEIN